MKAASFKAVLALFSLSAACATTHADHESNAHTLTFSEYRAAGIVIAEGGYQLFEGDLVAHTDEDIRRFYDHYVRQTTGLGTERSGLQIHEVGSADDRWTWPNQRLLTYCVSTAFESAAPGRYNLVRQVVADAASAWQGVADVQFRHVAAADVSCTASNASVVFDVVPADLSGAEARAASFFPNDSRSNRELRIDRTAFASDIQTQYNRTLPGIMRHEFGHILGFMHENDRSPTPSPFPYGTQCGGG